MQIQYQGGINMSRYLCSLCAQAGSGKGSHFSAMGRRQQLCCTVWEWPPSMQGHCPFCRCDQYNKMLKQTSHSTASCQTDLP